MRILHLTHRLPYAPNRGDRIRAYHTLRALRDRADIDLISLAHDDQEMAHQSEMSDLAKTVRVARIHRQRARVQAAMALVSARPLTHVLLDAPDVAGHIRQAISENPPDLVLAYCSGMARFALEPPLDRFPLVLDLVDVDSAKWRALAAAQHPLNPKRLIYAREAHLLERFERRAAHLAFATLVVNERERATLAAIAPEARIEVVANGVDTSALQPIGPPTAQPVAIFCGVMDYEPNARAARWLIQSVWPLVLARRGEARLLLVGANPTRRLVHLVARHPSVRLTGTVPDVRPYLWQAAVAVAPIFIARGMQNKAIEAIAAGLPVVATPQVTRGLPPQVAPACVEASDPQAFANAILTLFDLTADARRQMAGRAAVSTLSWQCCLDPLAALLHDAASHRATIR
jgi:polysaccharide biosynthesis protein PslH